MRAARARPGFSFAIVAAILVATCAAPSEPATPPRAIAPNSHYVCVSDSGSERRQSAIQFAPKVAQLCQKHPEMGPCRYERNLCRRSGGRVYTPGGEEITMEKEAQYDRRVMRVRLNAD